MHGFSAIRLLLIVPVLLLAAGQASCGSDDAETAAVRRAAEEYLAAEQEGDLEKVYSLLAPSSDFRRSYTLEQFRELYWDGAPRIRSWRIEKVGPASGEVDRDRHPDLEKAAVVTVVVRFAGEDAEGVNERTSILTFVKQDGKWYKG